MCSTRLEAAQAPDSRRSSWRRSPPAMARWPGLNSPSTLRLRFERVEPTQKHSEHFCHRWPQLLWSHTTPSYRPIQALSQSMSVSLWTTRFRGFPVFWNLTMSDVQCIAMSIWPMSRPSTRSARGIFKWTGQHTLTSIGS